MKNDDLALKDLIISLIEFNKELERDDGLTDEEITTKYISGFCGFLAKRLETAIKLIYERKSLQLPRVRAVTFDLDVGPHMYLKFPNPNKDKSANLLSQNNYLFADISGVYTYDEVLKRNASPIFAEANKAVNSKKVRKIVIDKKRDEKIETEFFKMILDKLNTKKVEQ